jgi:hypothetical protein
MGDTSRFELVQRHKVQAGRAPYEKYERHTNTFAILLNFTTKDTRFLYIPSMVFYNYNKIKV